jgi:hypothetical protein
MAISGYFFEKLFLGPKDMVGDFKGSRLPNNFYLQDNNVSKKYLI